MIIDTHVYLGSSLAGYSLTEEELLNKLSENKIDKCFVLPVMPYNYRLEEQNDYISDAQNRFSDRFIGFCRVDPRQKGTAKDELRRCIKILGLKGLVLNPFEENFQINSPIVVPLMEEAKNLGIPVIIEAGYPWVSHATQIADLCRDFRKVPVIMTHGGQLNISGLAQADAMVAIKDCPNVLIDTAGVYRQDFLEEVIEGFGVERVLFGSHTPVFSQEFELSRIYAIKTGIEERQKILGQNAAKLVNLQQ